ncbi:hypothetical protein Ddye_014568 [Dipteronia dyeriana]|uniref:Phosphofructokinase domain-containing protein n=1 Tax=Dipteronia dyeriana TaxID=168575 RepID=A0AAD9X8J0_9ROSI|nr:hypothetical protein Ddye_014568 [Dipteronia dyeriana]
MAAESEAEGTININSNSPYVVLHHIAYDISSSSSSSASPHLACIRAGPRKQIFFDPTDSTRAAIVNCGGLSPGLNTVIRELVVGLWDLYGLRHIYGIQVGYRGFYSSDMAPLQLNPKMVHGWHKTGGTLLQTSMGGFHLQNIVDAIQRYGFNQKEEMDVGSWLKSELKEWWARDHPNELFAVKYIDPTYMIRAVPALQMLPKTCTVHY